MNDSAAVMETGTTNLTATVDQAGVALVTLNRPERKNAMTPKMWAGLASVLEQVETDPLVRCVVLTGAGGAFCSGGDVKAMAATQGNAPPEQFDQRVHRQRLAQRAISGRLFNMPKPTLAVLGGAAAGAGFSLALACDMRIAVDTAVLTTAFGRVGLSGDYGGSWLLTQLVGPARAKELYYLSDRIPMDRAVQLGIVNNAVPAEEFDEAWTSLAERLATGPSIAYRYMKENINRSVNADLETVMDLEASFHRHTATTEDHRNAAAAFVEKRNPTFVGK